MLLTVLAIAIPFTALALLAIVALVLLDEMFAEQPAERPDAQARYAEQDALVPTAPGHRPDPAAVDAVEDLQSSASAPHLAPRFGKNNRRHTIRS